MSDKDNSHLRLKLLIWYKSLESSISYLRSVVFKTYKHTSKTC